MSVNMAERICARKLTTTTLLQRTHLSALIQRAGELFNLRTFTFSEAALSKISGNQILRRAVLDGSITPELLAQNGLRQINIHFGKSLDAKTIPLIIAEEEAGKTATVFYSGNVFEADIPGLAESRPAPPPPADQRPPVHSPKVEARFIENPSPDNVIATVAEHLSRGALVALVGMPVSEKDFDERMAKLLAAKLAERDLEPGEIEKRIAEFRNFVFAPKKGQTTTQLILESGEKLAELRDQALRGREVVVLSTQYELLNQWLLCNPAKALELSKDQRRILIEAAEFGQFEKGTHRSEGGKLVLVLEELMAEERRKFPGQPPRASMAAAYPALREIIFAQMSEILESLEKEAVLPNGLQTVYRTARQRLQNEVAFLAAEAANPESTVVQIRGNVILVNLPWRQGDNPAERTVSRKAIYEFMGSYNRHKEPKDQLHIAVSFDPQKRLGYEYIIGVNPNSAIAEELDLLNLWQEFRNAENAARKVAGLPEPDKEYRPWGGHYAAGGSPVDFQGTLLSQDQIVSIIGHFPVVEHVRSGMPMYRRHTLNLPDYLVPRIPREARELLDRYEPVTVELHHGPESLSMDYLKNKRDQLEKLIVQTTVDGTKQHWYRVKGTNHFIVLNILGETKLEHMRLYLTYAGLTVERIYHHIDPAGYATAARRLIANTKAANEGQLPRNVVIGPGGALSNIVADRLNAVTALTSLQRSGLRGVDLLKQIVSVFDRTVTTFIEDTTSLLEYAKFDKKRGMKTPEPYKRKNHRIFLIGIARMLACFGFPVVKITPKVTIADLLTVKKRPTANSEGPAANLSPEDAEEFRQALVSEGYIDESGTISHRVYQPKYLDVHLPQHVTKRVFKLLQDICDKQYEQLFPIDPSGIEALRPAMAAGLERILPLIRSQVVKDETAFTAALEQEPQSLLVQANHAQAILSLVDIIGDSLDILGISSNDRPQTFSFGKMVTSEKIREKVKDEVYSASILNVPGREPILLVTIPFGNLTRYLAEALAAEALAAEGRYQIMFFGNGGAITGSDPRQQGTEVGNIFLPAKMLNEEGDVTDVKNAAIDYALTSGHEVIDVSTDQQNAPGDRSIVFYITDHASVVSPLLEHDARVADLRQRSADSVEVEMRYMIEGLGKARENIETSMMGYYSDVIEKAGASLSDAELGRNPRILRAKQTMATYMLAKIR